MISEIISARCRGILLLSLIIALSTFAQIPIAINSGNPVRPFPQFLPYENATATFGNLATRNACGVTHAEMEQSIRDAYRIMMNRASKPGGGVGGTDYIYYKSTPSCTEGDGYAMLAAAAMADKQTFDGLWLWIHDNAMNKVKRYGDCVESSPGYRYSRLPSWDNKAGGNSAADGDFDIGLALLCAYLQWGEFMGINDGCGNPISYKQAAIDFMTALTDTFTFATTGSSLLSGDIGLDGYLKSGDSWGELTDWANNLSRSGFPLLPESKGPQQVYFDYAAPSYYHAFADFLSSLDSTRYAWNIRQFRRAEASSDWLMGKLYQKDSRNIPFAGKVSLASDTVATFTNVMMGEDFRLGWRTILNYVWHGNPLSTWNPATHQVNPSEPNTYERDFGLRYAKFLWDNRQAPWNSACVLIGSPASAYWGPSILTCNYNIDGSGGSFYHLNWTQGAGSASAVTAQNFNLMAEMYRQCEIEWDVETVGDGYLTAVPYYFHDWFRLLGMLVLSGNYQAPNSIKPAANMKVYLDIDKTFAPPGDTITYTIDYRNYGSIDATGVSIVDTLHPDFAFISATGVGTYNAATKTVTWNIGAVPGFKTSTGITPTKGQVKFKVALSNPTQKQYRNRANIACSNCPSWTSNEFPNSISSTLKRNFLDIINQPMNGVELKTAFMPLHGGRPGVHFSFSRSTSVASPQMEMKFQIFNDAQESYINRGNYRFSYFIYDTVYKGLGGPKGWTIQPMIREGFDTSSLIVLHQNLPPGSDSHGKWNQRIIFQFSDPFNVNRDENKSLSTTDRHLEEYRGITARIHRGLTYPFRFQAYLVTAGWQPVQWSDDWSWNTFDTGSYSKPGYPITPDFTDPSPAAAGIPVNRLNPKHCDTVAKSVDNILVEEWDGYAWRRIFGNAPDIRDTTSITGSVVSSPKQFAILSVRRSAITYFLPVGGITTIHLLDSRGRIVSTLFNGYRSAGTYSSRLDTKSMGPGVYIVRIMTGNHVYAKKYLSLY